jgi:hypothetical protein
MVITYLAPPPLLLTSSKPAFFGRCGRCIHYHDGVDHGGLLSTEPRMGMGPAAGGSVLSRRDNAFGGEVLERQWGRLERESPGRSRPPHYRNSPPLDQQLVSSTQQANATFGLGMGVSTLMPLIN